MVTDLPMTCTSCSIKGLLLLLSFVILCTCIATAQSNQTVGNGAATQAVSFPTTGCVYNWVNNTPGIGLAASGTGNIDSFIAVNNGTSPITATITATPATPGIFAYFGSASNINNFGKNGTITVLNTATNTVVATIQVGASPIGVAISPDGSRVYVANLVSQNTSVIDASTNKVIATIMAGGGDYLAISPDGKYLYIESSNGNIIVINTTTNSIVATIATKGNSGMAVSPDGKYLYVAGQNTPSSNLLTVINTQSNTVLTTIPVGVAPEGVAITPDGKQVYVANYNSNSVTVINALTNTVTQGIAVGHLPADIVISKDGSTAYVVNYNSDNVSVINTVTNIVVDSIAVGSGPFGMALTPDGKELYVLNNGSNDISIINTATNKVSKTINGGSTPFLSIGARGNFITGAVNCTGSTVTFTITVYPGPTIIPGAITGSIIACKGSASVSPNISQFTVSGISLTSNISATAPASFELSTAPAGPYTNNLSLLSSASTTIYARLAASATMSVSGNITLTSPGAASQSVPVSGSINSLPNAAFTINSVSCNGDFTSFKDQSTATGTGTINGWLWDFGDGQTSTLQNPTHNYLNPGDYNAVLTVTDNYGCSSKSAAIAVHVITAPVANFTASTTNCVAGNATFTDRSSAATGTIKLWIWNYGDGKIDTLMSAQDVLHSFTQPGIDTVKLIVITNSGCSSSIFALPIKINPLPTVDFMLPSVCLSDAYAQFTDNSSITDNTQSLFTYSWNFGDNYAIAANNVSDQQNPRHKYAHVGTYTVTLTVTSAYGCVASRSQVFTVNGAVPKAAFSVENSTALCSADSVVFDDQSNVDFGNITKIVWYFDYNNHPADTVVYTTATMRTDKKYSHSYGFFNTPLKKNYTVMMIAYSGQICQSELQQTITINANPVITLLPTDSISICQSDTLIQVGENKNGFVGTGVFSGIGINSTGLFNPKLSGVGTFTINYLFTAANTGCTYPGKLKITVNPSPVITGPTQLNVLEGGQVKLNASASIASGTMIYKWSPAYGLDNPNILNPVANPFNNQIYTLTTTSNNGCTTVASVLVNVLKLPVIPNTFTPNGDGINDTWNITYINNYPNSTVEVFNRNGQQVFFSRQYPIPWNGKYKGNNLPAGTYYYIVTPNSGLKPLSGSIVIIR